MSGNRLALAVSDSKGRRAETRDGVSEQWQRLDELLFVDTGWFVLDADNQCVAGVRPASLTKGLAMAGRGRVATVVGRLRPDVVAVDVDLVGERGHAVAEHLAAWCRRERLWHVVRPSGGADGRAHVVVACGARREHLEAEVDSLRRSYGVSARMIDARQALRPLSAPHRLGSCPAPLGDPASAVRTLRTALKALERAARPVGAPAAPPSSSPRRTPLTPRRQRARRPLPAEWARYMATGERPELSENARDRTGTTYELLATRWMLWSGWTPQQAWAAIAAAHPDAMPRARASWHRWVGRWNQLVMADDDYAGVADLSAETAAAIAAARERLRLLAWSTPLRARPALLTVGHTVLDRMERTGNLRVPVPQRDLVLDTGITDRSTIATHLRALHEAVGILHEVFDPRARASSSFEFEVHKVGGVWETPPPRLHTPGGGELPRGLPRMTWPVLRGLPAAGAPLEDLAHACQMATSPTAEATPSQRRTLLQVLTGLARLGLVECDEGGRWRPTGARLGEEQRRRAREDLEPVRRSVAAERAVYRAPRHSDAWAAAHAAAVKAQRAKQVGWWAGLPQSERRRRTTELADRFASMSIQEQLETKHRWAERDARAGIDPKTRHARWLARQDPDDLARRAAERAAHFDALPSPARRAAVDAWTAYRQAWSIKPSSPPAALPSSSRRRDDEFMDAAVGGAQTRRQHQPPLWA